MLVVAYSVIIQRENCPNSKMFYTPYDVTNKYSHLLTGGYIHII